MTMSKFMVFRMKKNADQDRFVEKIQVCIMTKKMAPLDTCCAVYARNDKYYLREWAGSGRERDREGKEKHRPLKSMANYRKR